MNWHVIIGFIIVIIITIVLGLYFGTNTYGNNEIPVDGKWSNWVNNPCTKSCGGGEISSSRVCTPPKHGGEECQGSSTKTEPCNTQDCPIDGVLSEWENDGECVDDKQNQIKTCTPPQHGGKECGGPKKKGIPCNTPVDGILSSDWVKDGECSKSGCIAGEQKYTKTCIPPKHGGKECIGDSEKSVICNDKKCKIFHLTDDNFICLAPFTLNNGFIIQGCDNGNDLQKLVYNPNDGTISQKTNRSKCVNKEMKFSRCDKNDENQQWSYNGFIKKMRSKKPQTQTGKHKYFKISEKIPDKSF